MTEEHPESLSAAEIENLFIGITHALCVSVALVEVLMASDGRGCLIRSHDPYGRLPDIRIIFSKNLGSTLDSLSIRIAQQGMTVRLRQELANAHRGCRLLTPTSKKKTTWAGIRIGEKTITAQGPDPCHAYQELIRLADKFKRRLEIDPIYPELNLQSVKMA